MNRRDCISIGGIALTTGTLIGASSRLAAATTHPGFDEYIKKDAMGIAEWISSGDVQPIEVLEMAIARAESVNGAINAINIPLYETARNAIHRGLPAGPFHGVPWLLKDLHMKLKGTRTTNGSAFFKDYVAPHNSTLVDRYLAAGLVVLGKTHSPEFGGTATTESTLWGETANPWNLKLSSGGSSGGSAAAIAAGILPAANASDGGGSIRIPAAFCGLFGFKPTRARTPLGPDRFEGANGQSVAHAITRSVRDSAALLDLSRGAELGSPYDAPPVVRPYLQEMTRQPGQLRIALVTKPVIPVPVQQPCLDAVNHAAQLCENLGHHVAEATLQIEAQEYYEAVGTISSVGTLALVTAREQQLGRSVTEGDLEPIIYARMQQGKSVTGLAYANARATYHRVGATLAKFQQNYDVILTPTTAAPAPKLGEMSLSGDFDTYVQTAIGASVFTQLYNVTGQPAMSVPLHWSSDGLPVGVMFAGRFGEEATLFQLAAQLEQAQPWKHRLSKIS